MDRNFQESAESTHMQNNCVLCLGITPALGISPCLYFINDWDCWEANDTAPVYLQKQLDMLTELLTKYGTIDRLWFDFYGSGECVCTSRSI